MIELPTSSEPIASIVIPTCDNLEMLYDCLAAIARSTDPAATPYEAIVLFQEMKPGEVAAFLERVCGIRPLQVGLNLGFGAANNFAVRHARGKYLVLLNDDTEPQAGWLEALVRLAESDSAIGAVGSRLIYPDGTLQEAGAVLWSDGTTACPGRGDPSVSLTYSYVRDVDFASANGLLVSRETYDAAGGFDERFYPGYFEDVDLCLTIRHALGRRVVYEPRSQILHVESATMSRDPQFRGFLFRRHRALLCEKWSEALTTYAPPQPDSPIALEEAVQVRRGIGARVLVVDDRLPEAGMGSGFGRTDDLLADLCAAGFGVAFYASNRGIKLRKNGLAGLGVDLVTETLDEHLRRPGKRYDVVVISRPHNFQFFDLVKATQPQAKVIYDAEALYHKRLYLQAALEPDPPKKARIEAGAAATEALETRIARSADLVVTVSGDELAWLQSVDGHRPIGFMLPLGKDVRLTPAGAEQRAGAVFVAGWLAGEESPNVGALEWFVQSVLPAVLEEVPGFHLLVTGKRPPLSVRALESPHVALAGFVESVERTYESARVAVVPMRAGAGVKIKTIEAMQHGVPVVATTVGAEGLGLTDGEGIDVADDPAEFARRLIALLQQREVWDDRRAALERIVLEWDAQRVSWGSIVQTLLRTNASPAAAGSLPQFEEHVSALAAGIRERHALAVALLEEGLDGDAGWDRAAQLVQRFAPDAGAGQLELLLLDWDDFVRDLQRSSDACSLVT
jgi:GT2 family glycosyltransferase